MPMRMTSSRVRLFVFDAATVFRRLQRLYCASAAAALGGGDAVLLAFRNSLVAVLAQLSLFPGLQKGLLASLLDCVAESGSFDGLESAFLTLLNAAAAAADRRSYQAGLTLWTRLGTTRAVAFPDPDPILFYNAVTKKLSFLTLDALARLRPGGPFFNFFRNPHRLAGAIEAFGFAKIPNPFVTETVPPPLHAITQEPPTPSLARKQEAIVHCARAHGAALIAAAVKGGFEPASCRVVGMVLFVVDSPIADGIEMSRCLNDLVAPIDVRGEPIALGGDGEWLVLDSDGQLLVTVARSTGENERREPEHAPEPDPGRRPQGQPGGDRPEAEPAPRKSVPRRGPGFAPGVKIKVPARKV
jgi:hypothetical protein